MARREYTMDLEEAFISELERIAGELGMIPGQAIETIAGNLHGASFGSAITVATADGARPVITHRSIEIG
jgi:hypothetical protein